MNGHHNARFASAGAARRDATRASCHRTIRRNAASNTPAPSSNHSYISSPPPSDLSGMRGNANAGAPRGSAYARIASVFP